MFVSKARWLAIGLTSGLAVTSAAQPPNFVRAWPTIAAGPSSLTIDLAGTFWVADFDGQALERYSFNGTPLGFVSLSRSPRGIAAHPAAGLLIAYSLDNIVRATTISPTASLLQFVFYQPLGVATDPSGKIFVSEHQGARIIRFSLVGQYETVLDASMPGDMAASAEWLYVLETETCQVVRMTTAGAVLGSWGGCGSEPGQIGPAGPALTAGITTDHLGRVYIADVGNNRIQVFDATGTFLLQWGSTGSEPGQFDQPRDVVVNSSGEVFVADYGNNRIQQFAPPIAVLPTSWGHIKQRYR